jgi:hypothetical protein
VETKSNLDSDDKFEGWVILEIMGHRRLAGYMREQEIAGKAFLRIDVPSEPPVTQFYGAESVYCITPTTEETARAASGIGRVAPVARWELPAAPAADHDPAEDLVSGEPPW